MFRAVPYHLAVLALSLLLVSGEFVVFTAIVHGGLMLAGAGALTIAVAIVKIVNLNPYPRGVA